MESVRKIRREILRLGKRLSRQSLNVFIRQEIAGLQGLILDLGCGGIDVGFGGRVSAELVPCGSIIGLDIRLRPGVDVVGDAHRLPFAGGVLDGIICIGVMQFVSQPHVVVAEMGRVLKDGGEVALAIPFIFPLHDRPYDLFRYTRYGLQLLFKGWEVRIRPQVSAYMTFVILFERLIMEDSLLCKIVSPLILALAFALSLLDPLVSALWRTDYITSSYLVTARKYGRQPL